MTATQEIERRHEAGETMEQIAQSIGVTKQCISSRIKNARVAREAELKLPDLKIGDMLREIDTGRRFQYVAPSAKPGCIRVATDGGAQCMDMSLKGLEKVDCGNLDIVFSLSRGDDPNDPRFRRHIEHALKIRKELDAGPQTIYKVDPDSNLRATVQRKSEARRKLPETAFYD